MAPARSSTGFLKIDAVLAAASQANPNMRSSSNILVPKSPLMDRSQLNGHH
jgi:hypothetical protein